MRNPKKIEQEKTSEKKKADDISWNSKCAQQKNKTAKYNNAAAILRIPMIFLPQIVRKLKRGDAAARHCATALPCAPRAS